MKKSELVKIIKECKKELMRETAGEEAKKKGLIHLGFGYYGKKKGEAEFKSDGDKLRPLSDKEKQQSKEKTGYKPAAEKTAPRKVKVVDKDSPEYQKAKEKQGDSTEQPASGSKKLGGQPFDKIAGLASKLIHRADPADVDRFDTAVSNFEDKLIQQNNISDEDVIKKIKGAGHDFVRDMDRYFDNGGKDYYDEIDKYTKAITDKFKKKLEDAMFSGGGK